MVSIETIKFSSWIDPGQVHYAAWLLETCRQGMVDERRNWFRSSTASLCGALLCAGSHLRRTKSQLVFDQSPEYARKGLRDIQMTGRSAARRDHRGTAKNTDEKVVANEAEAAVDVGTGSIRASSNESHHSSSLTCYLEQDSDAVSYGSAGS